VAAEVTVVIPTFDRWHSLARALSTALAQQGVELQVVVVDDGSPLAAPAWLTATPRVRVERLPARRGVAAARNAGIACARTPWVAFLDDDDLWAPDKLRRQLDAAVTASAAFAYAAGVAVDGDLRPLRTLPAPPTAGLEEELLRRNVMPAGGSNVVARAELVQSVGGFDERFEHLDDWDMWIRLARSARAARCDEILVAHVLHPRSRVVGQRDVALAELARLADKHGDGAAAFDRTDFVRWLAVAHRRAGRRRAAVALYLSDPNAGNLARAAATACRLPVARPARAERLPDWLRDPP
jgi:glycosyltransferase involved in cell wall biosynthesis